MKIGKRSGTVKTEVKKSKRSGTATNDSEKAARALFPYKFFSWLDNFVYVRENLKVDEGNDICDGESDDVDRNYGETEANTIAKENNVPMETVLNPEPLKRKLPSTKNTQRNKQDKKSDNAKDNYL